MLFGLILINMIVPFIFSFMFISKLGEGQNSDLLFLSMSATGLIVLAFTSGIHNYLLSKLSLIETHDERRQELSSIFYLYIIGMLLLLLLFWMVSLVLSLGWVYLIVGVFTILTASLTACISVFNSYFYSISKPLRWELVVACFNLVLFFCIYFVSLDGLGALTLFLFLLFLRALASFVVLCVWEKISPYSDLFSVWIQLKNIKTMVGLSIYSKSEPFLDRVLLSSVPGLVTQFHIASQVYNTISVIWGKLVTSPLIARCSSNVNPVDVECLILSRFRLSLLCGGAGVVIAFLMFNLWPFLPLVEIIDFPIYEYLYVIVLMSVYGALQMVGHIVAAFFYLKGNYEVVPRVAAVNFTLFFPIKILAYYLWGLEGFVIATTFYHFTNIAVNMALQRSRYAFFFVAKIFSGF